MDDAGNLREPTELVAPERPTAVATSVVATGTSGRQGANPIRGGRVRQLTPIVREAAARPAERSILYLSASVIRSQITRYPQAGDMVDAELARQGWYPGRPVGGSLTLLAALIGSWVDRDEFGGRDWMLERAAEFMYANEDEQVIRIGRNISTPANIVEQLQMHHTLLEMAVFPRHLLDDEEAALHGLAGGLDTVIEVYDATVNEIVMYGATTSPTRARWIVRYPNGTYGASLCNGTDDQLPGPGPAEDRPREPPPRANRTARMRREGLATILAIRRPQTYRLPCRGPTMREIRLNPT